MNSYERMGVFHIDVKQLWKLGYVPGVVDGWQEFLLL
jgi:hypothetical protein